jgi:hypothetical protein
MKQLVRSFLLTLALCGWAGRLPAVTLCVEAESALTNEAPMTLVRAAVPGAGIKPVAEASEAMYLEVPLGAGKPPKVKAGSAKIDLAIPVDGTYTFWLRTYWEGECSNTIQVQIDAQPPFLVGGDATYHVWHWVRFPVSKLTPAPKLTKGAHTVTILHREDGVRIDQLLLTTSPRYVPAGVEKAGVSP